MWIVHSPDDCFKRGKTQAPVMPTMEPPRVPLNATKTRCLHASAMWIPRGRAFSGLEPVGGPAAWYTCKGLGRLNMNLGGACRRGKPSPEVDCGTEAMGEATGEHEKSGRSRFPVSARLRRCDEPRYRMPVPSHTGGDPGRFSNDQESARGCSSVGAPVPAGDARPLEDWLLHYSGSPFPRGNPMRPSCSAGIARLHGMTDSARVLGAVLPNSGSPWGGR